MLTRVAVLEPDSESEPPSPRPALKRKSPSPGQARLSPSKRRRISPSQVPDGGASSVTEPETDDEPVITATPKAVVSTNTNGDSSVTEPETESDAAQGDADDSETEPDTESDDEDEDEYDNGKRATKTANTRPAFPLALNQKSLGPLVLSSSYNYVSTSAPTPVKSTKPRPIQVPASINTHLRDYQRDGVRFFWERFQEDRGGLLGDDMGLVRLSCDRKSKTLIPRFSGQNHPNHCIPLRADVKNRHLSRREPQAQARF